MPVHEHNIMRLLYYRLPVIYTYYKNNITIAGVRETRRDCAIRWIRENKRRVFDISVYKTFVPRSFVERTWTPRNGVSPSDLVDVRYLCKWLVPTNTYYAYARKLIKKLIGFIFFADKDTSSACSFNSDNVQNNK